MPFFLLMLAIIVLSITFKDDNIAFLSLSTILIFAYLLITHKFRKKDTISLEDENLRNILVKEDRLRDERFRQLLLKEERLREARAREMLLAPSILDAPNTSPAPSSKTKIEHIENKDIQAFIVENYNNGHTENAWKSIGLYVPAKYRYRNKKYYSYNEVEADEKYHKYLGLTKNQRKVKILGDALIRKTGSKVTAKNILISQYGFKENTAKYATGYAGFYDW